MVSNIRGPLHRSGTVKHLEMRKLLFSASKQFTIILNVIIFKYIIFNVKRK